MKDFLEAAAGCLDNLGTILKICAKVAHNLSALYEG